MVILFLFFIYWGIYFISIYWKIVTEIFHYIVLLYSILCIQMIPQWNIKRGVQLMCPKYNYHHGLHRQKKGILKWLLDDTDLREVLSTFFCCCRFGSCDCKYRGIGVVWTTKVYYILVLNSLYIVFLLTKINIFYSCLELLFILCGFFFLCIYKKYSHISSLKYSVCTCAIWGVLYMISLSKDAWKYLFVPTKKGKTRAVPGIILWFGHLTIEYVNDFMICHFRKHKLVWRGQEIQIYSANILNCKKQLLLVYSLFHTLNICGNE